jgi:hypothetical protein
MPNDSEDLHTAITIQGQTYLAPIRYSAGHVLNEDEARALQRLRLENIRNNFASVIKRASEEGRELPSAEEFAAYEAAYTFGIRRTRLGAPRDPVAVEERRLATAAVKNALAAKGYKWSDLTDADRAGYVERAIATGRYRAAAQAILDARNMTASEPLEV